MSDRVPISKIAVMEELQGLFRPLQPEELHALRRMMMKTGTCDPVKVIRRGNIFLVVDGHHRLQMAKQLGWKEIPVEVLDDDERSATLTAIVANFAHRHLTRAERYAMIARLFDLLDGDAEEVARLLGTTPGAVREAVEVKKKIEDISSTARQHLPAKEAEETTRHYERASPRAIEEAHRHVQRGMVPPVAAKPEERPSGKASLALSSFQQLGDKKFPFAFIDARGVDLLELQDILRQVIVHLQEHAVLAIARLWDELDVPTLRDMMKAVDPRFQLGGLLTIVQAPADHAGIAHTRCFAPAFVRGSVVRALGDSISSDGTLSRILPSLVKEFLIYTFNPQDRSISIPANAVVIKSRS